MMDVIKHLVAFGLTMLVIAPLFLFSQVGMQVFDDVLYGAVGSFIVIGVAFPFYIIFGFLLCLLAEKNPNKIALHFALLSGLVFALVVCLTIATIEKIVFAQESQFAFAIYLHTTILCIFASGIYHVTIKKMKAYPFCRERPLCS